MRYWLGALRRAWRRRTKQWIATLAAGPAVLAGVAYAGVGAYHQREQRAECALEGDRVSAIVRPETQLALHMKFLATRSPMAESAYEHSMAVLDPYAKTLAARTTQACL